MISFGGMSIIGIRPTDWGANFTRNRKARAHFVVINQGVYQFYMSSDTRKFSMLFENASLKFNASCYMKSLWSIQNADVDKELCWRKIGFK